MELTAGSAHSSNSSRPDSTCHSRTLSKATTDAPASGMSTPETGSLSSVPEMASSSADIDIATVYIARLGMGTSAVCFVLGFPCAPEAYVSWMFRLTCVGYFAGNAAGTLLTDPAHKGRAFRLALLSNAVSAWIVSAWWCLSFSDWCMLMLLEHMFMLIATATLTPEHMMQHMFFTFAGSVAGYIARDEELLQKKFLELTSSGTTAAVKAWIVSLLLIVATCVAGIGYSGFFFSESGQRRWAVIRQAMLGKENKRTAPREEEAKFVPTSSNSKSSRSNMSSNVSSNNSSPPVTGTALPPRMGDVPIVSPIEGLQLDKAIGQGSFGRVYFGHLEDAPVAVKIMSWSPNKKSKAPPVKEAMLSTTMKHPNLVESFKHCAMTVTEPIVALSVDEVDVESAFEVWLVQEWCDLGTVANYCDKNRSDEKGLLEVYEMMADTCRGGAYLHEQGIVHGDLTGNNVLLKTTAVPSKTGRMFVCKICDFGLARVLEGLDSALVTSQLGTVSHMPPELFTLDRDTMRFSKKVDIYSLGMLLWQAIEGEYPYKGHSVPQIIISVSRGKRPKFTSEIPQAVADIFSQCTKSTPAERPPFTELLARFEELAQLPAS